MNALPRWKLGIRPVTQISMRCLSTLPGTSGKSGEALSSIPLREKASLYVHWPYCSKRCHYCNFNKYVAEHIDHERMRECFTRETRTLLALSGVKRVTSVFFGGGTPSLAKPRTLGSVIDLAKNLTLMDEDAEVTMEANPTSSEANKLADFKAAGVNRLSLGIQSFNDSHLKFLGRGHSSADALKVLEDAKKAFPTRVSIDLIFGIPGQTLDDWVTDLKIALDVCDDHISLYQLTLERGTPLFQMKERGDFPVLGSDLSADMYSTAVNMLSRAGFSRYEVSNFSKGKLSASAHNQSYWNGEQYIGIGPGAHGRFSLAGDGNNSGDTRAFREARIQALDPESWMEEVETFGHGTRKRVELSRVDVLRELIMAGLRTSAGIQNSTWIDISGGRSLEAVFQNSDITRDLCQTGFLEMTQEFMRATGNGLVMLDSLLPEIINELNVYYDNMARKSKGTPSFSCQLPTILYKRG